MSIYVTGDIHRDMITLTSILQGLNWKDELIILGDVSFNYTGGERDEQCKKIANECLRDIYCVRGNHEMRPEDVPGMVKIYDKDIKNCVYWQEEYPFINYLIDGEVYEFNGYKCLVIGGAYSVDKYYRIERSLATGDPSYWFNNEQLNEEERARILKNTYHQEYDFILTHTCPLSLQPMHLFLNMVDQSLVDNTMEKFLEEIYAQTLFTKAWLFGHYHADQIIAPHIEMLYHAVINLDTIAKDWDEYEKYRKNNTQCPINVFANQAQLDLSPNYPFWQNDLIF